MRFDRQAAVAYATEWALRRNPKYPDYSGSAGGGDCTNFISQATFAGGWPMISVPLLRRSSAAWYCDGRETLEVFGKKHTFQETSYAWSAVRFFADFVKLTGRAAPCKRGDLEVGDLVMLKQFDIKYHLMIITSKHGGPKGNQLLFCGHTTDRQNAVLDDHVSPDSKTLYFWKVADVFSK